MTTPIFPKDRTSEGRKAGFDQLTSNVQSKYKLAYTVERTSTRSRSSILSLSTTTPHTRTCVKNVHHSIQLEPGPPIKSTSVITNSSTAALLVLFTQDRTRPCSQAALQQFRGPTLADRGVPGSSHPLSCSACTAMLASRDRKAFLRERDAARKRRAG
ncbi:hypothetical protein EJ07DRAFT_158139 [Lizonia empirigonia]|nr:hypothetical protein EJ07DRAFT_158139 [Lizonia empirigonia]